MQRGFSLSFSKIQKSKQKDKGILEYCAIGTPSEEEVSKLVG